MKSVNRIIFLAFFIFSLFHMPMNVVANTDNKTTFLSSNEIKKMEQYIENQMTEGKIPGASVVIVKDNKTVYQNGFGYANIEEKKNITSNTLFELGSNSKAFTALGILKLQQDGLIVLSDPVSKYIPWLQMTYRGEAVSPTIQQFLNQTSGVPFRTIDTIPVSDREDALEKTVQNLKGIELDTKPGDHFQYATINYDVLGLIIEKVTRKSFETYMKENILQPLELNNTYLFSSSNASSQKADGYKLSFFSPAKYEAPPYKGNTPAGYFITTTEDVAKWLKIQLETSSTSTFDKQLIKKSHIASSMADPLSDGSTYSNGWFISKKDGGKIFHGGNNPNYSSYILLKPDEKLGIAILTNTNSAYTELIGQGLEKILHGDEPIKTGSDLNRSADKVAIFLICIFGFLCILTLFFVSKAVYEVSKKQRTFEKKTLKSWFVFFTSLFLMICVTYSLKQIPTILYDGMSWEFIFVWLPYSIKIAYHVVLITLWIGYAYFSITFFFTKKSKKQLILLGVISIVSGLGNAIVIFSINMAIAKQNDLNILLYFVLGIVLYVGGQRIVRKKLIGLTNNMVYLKRMEIVKKILKTPYQDFENIESGRIQATLNNDTETVSRLVNLVITAITSSATLLCCFIYLGFISFYGLLLSIVIITAIASIYFLVGIYANRIGERSRDIQNTFFSYIDDLIGGFKELSLHEKKKEHFVSDMQRSCNEYRIMRGKATMAFANMFVVGEILFTLAIGAVAFLFPLVFKEIGTGTLTSYIFVLLYMTGPVHGILDTVPNLIDVKISWKRINNLITQLSSLEIREVNFSQVNQQRNVEVTLKNVEYEYTKSQDSAFKIGPINYQFKSGEVIFITGGNGSGKSTLAKLITGLYSPTNGQITLNGRTIEARELSQYYSAIFSDFHLFEKLYGIDCEGKEAEIQEYLKILQMESKVQIRDGKFTTINLSTGQKKRLALLISYLEDKPIYLFDEWAADQDPEFRKFFYNVLLPDLKRREKCIIAITHDDYYFGLADKMLRMEFGQCKSNEFLTV
ncbi:cyclic peptide transporter family protein [Brevibacillus laterosporus GI-9]|uniref:cyclic peptide export ABC transporter n=1 Tax=Brevibacillus TaxID=55080 RepID=UPI0002405095|nr:MULTISPECIES: cyclic peptide export ABC transporter [Brevibacillus]MCR8966028.1 cyclic peptide export ABC transporter [Brevibacillus laterosporus]MCZ0838184.1 cyclic peptide export ABC transporter [Brevibacillus halotolerans]CCF15399.1 cyclic peptide transporter family protein [Brevibacillus laterosporus GI-9]